MHQQQMTKEIVEFDNSLPDKTLSTMNTIWDQSTKIFAAVINNANLLPDDRKNKTYNGVPSYKKDDPETPGSNNKAKTQVTKLMLVRLQEEHALWLK